MLVIILLTCMICFLVLIITTIVYVISVLNDDDELDANDSLVLVSSPTILTSDCLITNISNNRISDNNKSNQIQQKKTTTAPQPASLNDSSEPVADVQGVDDTDTDLDSKGGWNGSATTQKTLISDQLGEPATKQLFDDFEVREIRLGGTGLHWCKTRKSLEKLIKLGVPLDTTNDRNETPLHVAIRRRKLALVIGLLCHGAKVDCKNSNGETPLIVACKHLDAYTCMLLLVFDAKYDEVDYSGNSARHHIASLAAKQEQQSSVNRKKPVTPNTSHLILAMLHEIGAKRCQSKLGTLSECMSPTGNNIVSSSNDTCCSDGCSPEGTFNGNSYNRWPNFKKESLYKRHMFSDIIKQCKRANNKRIKKLTCNHEQQPAANTQRDATTKRSRMLCIDGGGMRGIIVCQIMIDIEKYLKRPLIDYFDWVGGTSAGAFVSCALCTGMPLNQLRRVCFDAKDEVFTGNKPYNSKFLERVLKRTLGQETRLCDIKNKRLVVTTVLADRDPCQLRFFRNYHSADDLLQHFGFQPGIYNIMSAQSLIESDASLESTISTSSSRLMKTSSSSNHQDSAQSTMTLPNINKSNSDNNSNRNNNDRDNTITMLQESDRNPYCWQAVRASAAAPFFFKPYGPFLDGGIISNNPTLDIMAEYQSFHAVRKFLRDRVNYEQAKIIDKQMMQQQEQVNKQQQQQAVDIDSDNNNNDNKQRTGTTVIKETTTTPESSTFTLALCEPPSKLSMVVSLGTGRAKVVGKQEMFDFSQLMSGFGSVFSPVDWIRSIRAGRDLFKKLLQRSCQTEDHILDRAQGWCSSLKIPYFRINPPLANNMSIDDKRDEQLINAIWQAKLYMLTKHDQLKELAELLDGRDPADDATTDDDSWYSLRQTNSPTD